uniref:Uncharacterized protein n=1 Tax=Parascaris equorum TaxID=6256 RepID=A0A914RI82_PAREQ
MARSLYDSDYYKIEGAFVLPIRWMAWECLLLVSFPRAYCFFPSLLYAEGLILRSTVSRLLFSEIRAEITRVEIYFLLVPFPSSSHSYSTCSQTVFDPN